MNFAPLAALPQAAIESGLRKGGVCLDVGTFRFRVRSNCSVLADPLCQLYSAYPASLDTSVLVDFEIELRRNQKFWAREVEFIWEGKSPFPPLPISQTHPLFEWGLNWVIATLSGNDVVIHSAVVEKNGWALILPGDPGSGKSTLCATLALDNWRLLSDELTIIDRNTLAVRPVPRPISLKDQSIRLVQSTFPDTYLTKPISDTRKGDIAYAKPCDRSVLAVDQTAPIGMILYPRYKPESPLEITSISKAFALAKLLENTFNVGLLGKQGVVDAARAIDNAKCFQISYSRFDDLLPWLNNECPAPR